LATETVVCPTIGKRLLTFPFLRNVVYGAWLASTIGNRLSIALLPRRPPGFE